MAYSIAKNAEDQTIDVWIESSATPGTGLTGLTFETASLVCYYRRGAIGEATALALVTQTVTGAHADGGFVQISSANMPGVYRLDLADEMIEAGAEYVDIMLKGAADMYPCTVRVELFDSLTVASGVIEANVKAIDDDTTAAVNLESYCDGDALMPVTVSAGGSIRPTYYVSAAGSDSYGGTGWQDAWLTVTHAISEMDSGDALEIGPGTFSGEVDGSALTDVTFRGCGSATVLTHTTTPLKVGNRWTVDKLRAVCTADTGIATFGITAQSKTDVTIRDCTVSGFIDGIYAPSSVRLLVERCQVIGAWDGMQLGGATGFVVSESSISCSSGYDVPAETTRAIAATVDTGAYGLVRGCALSNVRNDTSAGVTQAINATNAEILVDGCQLYASQNNANGTGHVQTAFASLTGMLQLRNCTVCAVNAGSGTAYSLYNTTGGTLGIGATSYTGTTYGTITDYSQVGSQAALVANNLDHLCLTETAAADMTAEVADNTILSRILAAGDTSAFVPTTDGLQPIRDNVGTAGAGLTAVVWNATWDAEVQSEVNDALVALDLDHLLKVACDTSDITSNVVNYSVMAFAVADNGVIANFDPTTDSLDAIYDRILAVEVDTQDLQTQIGTDGAGLTDLGGMSTAMKAAVNAEVVDVLRTDTVTQIAAVPAANAALHTMIQYVYAAARNKRLTTSTTDVIRNDGDTGAIGTSTIADDGSTFTRGKYT